MKLQDTVETFDANRRGSHRDFSKPLTQKNNTVETFDANRRGSLAFIDNKLIENYRLLKPLMPIGVDHSRCLGSEFRRYRTVETFDANRRGSPKNINLLSSTSFCGNLGCQ